METSNLTSSTGDRRSDVVKNDKPWRAKYFFNVTFGAFALPGLLVSFPFLIFLTFTPLIVIAGPILLVAGIIFFSYHREYPEFHRAVCEGRIPQSTVARLLPFYLPLFYALIVMAVAYYRFGAHTHEIVSFFLCAFPFYALWIMAVAYFSGIFTEYFGLHGPTFWFTCLYLPHLLSAVLALYGTNYIFRYAPPTKHQKAGASILLFVTTLVAATTWYFYSDMRTKTLAPLRNVDRIGDERIVSSIHWMPTDELVPYEPFAVDNRLPKVENPTLIIRDNHPKIFAALSLYPVAATGVEAVYRQINVGRTYHGYCRGGTSPETFEAILEGYADMAFMFRPSEKQREEATVKGRKLVVTPIGREAFVFFVNKNNPIENLTTQQIRDIYTKRIANWSELGGPDRKIMPFQRPEGSGSQTAMLRVMDGTALPEPLLEEFQHSMGGIITTVADYRNYENSLGYSFRFYVTGMFPSDGVKMIAVDGVEPTLENIRSGAYPFIDELYIVTADNPPKNVQKLTDWFLSPQGQDVIERVGYVPLATADDAPNPTTQHVR